MPAGQLRHSVDVVRLTPTGDGQGGATTAPTTVVEAWPMAIDDAAPAWRISQVVGGQIADRRWILATCRPHAALTIGALLSWRGELFHVRAVQDVNTRGHWYVLAADAVVEG